MFLLLVAALPAAHAQILPVSFTKDIVPDSKIPSGIVLVPLPLPRSEPRKPVKDARPRLYLLIAAGVYTAASLDMQQSESMMPHFHENDPFARPLLRLPAPAYYASAALFATGINWLGWKMAQSDRWHKIWWIPQVASIAGNMAGYGYTRAHPSPH
jgi:hypothetical protein